MLSQLQASYSVAPTCLPCGYYFLLLESFYHGPELYLASPDYEQDAAPSEHPGGAVLLPQGRPDAYGLHVLYRPSYRPGRCHV